MPAVAGTGGTVLIAEDETELADLFTEWLDSDYDVRTTYCGTDALDALDEDVDVVLLDHDMPDIEGDDVFVTLRDRGYDCRVALVSGVIDPDIDRGFDAYLEKPVTAEELAATVETLLDSDSRDALERELSTKRIERNVLRLERSAAELEDDPYYMQLERDISRLESRLATLTPF